MRFLDTKFTLLTISCAFLQAAPSWSDDYYDYGVTLFNQHNFSLASRYFAQSLQNNPNDSNAAYYEANCLSRLGYREKAREAYRMIVDHFPGTAAAENAQQGLALLGGSNASNQGNSGVVTYGSGRSSSHGSSASNAEYQSFPDECKVYFSKNENNHMIIDASINGHPIKCNFDTGASTCHFGKNQLQSIGVSVPQGKPQSYTSGWAGRPVPIWYMTADVKVGSISRRMPITVEDDMSLEPLIGQSFFADFTYDIDGSGGAIIFKKKQHSNTAVPGGYSDPYAVPFRMIGTKMMVEVEMHGKKCPVFIDTGAYKTIFSQGCANALGIEIPSDAKPEVMTGIGGMLSGVEVNLDELRMGPIVQRSFPVNIMPTGMCAVGQDFLNGWRYTVDNQNGLVKFFH